MSQLKLSIKKIETFGIPVSQLLFNLFFYSCNLKKFAKKIYQTSKVKMSWWYY